MNVERLVTAADAEAQTRILVQALDEARLARMKNVAIAAFEP